MTCDPNPSNSLVRLCLPTSCRVLAAIIALYGSILNLRRLPNRLYHFLPWSQHKLNPFTLAIIATHLNHRSSHLLLAVPKPNSHVAQHRRVSNVAGIAVPLNVACPLEFGRVGMSSSNISGLQSLQLLLSAKFVRL